MKKIKALLALLVVAAMMASCSAEVDIEASVETDDSTEEAATDVATEEATEEATMADTEEATEAPTEEATEEETEAEVVDEVEPTTTEADSLEDGTPVVKVVSHKYAVGDGCYIEFIPHARYWGSWNNWITSYGLEVRYTGACETDAALAAKYNFNNVTECDEYYHNDISIGYSISNYNLKLVGTTNYAENADYIQSITFDGYDADEENGPSSVQCVADNEVEGTISFINADGTNTIISFSFYVYTDTTGVGDYTDDYIETWIVSVDVV